MTEQTSINFNYNYKIYISGKISGEKMHHASMKFGKAKKQVEDLGYQVIHPLEILDNYKCRWEQAAEQCKAQLKNCDGIYFLPDYTEDSIPQYELYYAKDNNIKVYKQLNDIPKLN